MPTLSKTFEHTCAAHTTAKVKVYNYAKAATEYSIYQEASQFFFEDLKFMLSQTNLNVTFSEDNSYATGTDCPYFEMFGLQFPFVVHVSTAYSNYYGVVPCIFRTGHYNVGNCTTGFRQYGSSDKYDYLSVNKLASLCPDSSTKLDLKYTINVVYNENWIIVSYTARSGNKYPLFSLIKGKDINNKEVVYMSANPNSCCYGGGSGTIGRSYSTTCAPSYHWLVWTDNWYMHEYNGQTRVPSSDTYMYYSSNKTYNSGLFLKLSPDDTISYIRIEDNRIQLMQPICCGNRVFFDNMYVVPDTVNTDCYYTINNQLYYCPGDYVVQCDQQYNASYMASYACRFLLKMEDTTSQTEE